MGSSYVFTWGLKLSFGRLNEQTSNCTVPFYSFYLVLEELGVNKYNVGGDMNGRLPLV